MSSPLVLLAFAALSGPALPGPALAGPARAAPPERLSHGPFQDVIVFRPPSGQARQIVLFLSGEGGWSAITTTMAETLTRQGALVAGIDDRRFVARLERGGGCIAPGGELEDLSHFIATRHRLSSHRPPLLAGYSAGAALAYAVAARAPRGAFSGLLTLGFSAAIPLREPPCRGGVLRVRPGVRQDTFHLIPGGALSVPWINLTGSRDHIRPAPLAAGFVSRVPGAQMVLLPNVDHTFAVPDRWVPQLRAAFERLTREGTGQRTSLSTTLPRTCPCSSVRCASAASSSG